MKLSSLHILHVQYTTRILLEGEKIKYKMCEVGRGGGGVGNNMFVILFILTNALELGHLAAFWVNPFYNKIFLCV